MPIVEGHGEVEALPIVIRRIWAELGPAREMDVLRPVRLARSKVLRRPDRAGDPTIDVSEIARAAALALSKSTPSGPIEVTGRLILIVLDANGDCPARLGPALIASAGAPHVACALPKVEFETWFVGAAESLADHLDLAGTTIPEDPESQRCGKRWISSRFKGTKYSETVDQPKLARCMDIVLCRRRCPSFDKLWREIESFSRRASDSAGRMAPG